MIERIVEADKECLTAKLLVQHVREVVDLRFGGVGVEIHRHEEQIEQLNSISSVYLTRDMFDTKHELLSLRVEKLERFQSWILGGGALLMVVSGIIGAVAERMFR